MATKGPNEILSVHELHNRNGSEGEEDPKVQGMKGGTAQDAIEMNRMGRAQELRVRMKKSSQ
jgi:hypothetical protein